MPDDIPFEDFLYQSIEKEIERTRARIIIIDNLTFLSDELERSKGALPLMKKLKALKNKYGLSILILAHTPKRDASKPITKNDLQGSRALLGFTDSCFAIGESAEDVGIRYVKQIKERETEKVYHDKNVIVFEIEKSHNFLQFTFKGFGYEYNFLKRRSEEELKELEEQIIELWISTPGISQSEIARQLKTYRKKVGRVLAKNEEVIEARLNGTGGTNGTPVQNVPPVPKYLDKQQKLDLDE